jgi:CheY-like chemotaxis protein
MSAQKILVVDDSVVVLKALELKLTAAGYTVSTAADGGGALAVIRQNRPDLIVLDINFPPDVDHGGGIAWDGFLIMQWLKRMEEAVNIPIIVITGGEPARYEQRARQLGATAFFHKPIDHDGLLDVISKTLGEPVPAA